MRGAEVGGGPRGAHLAAAFLASAMSKSSRGREDSALGVGCGAVALPVVQAGAAGGAAVIGLLLGPVSRFMRR